MIFSYSLTPKRRASSARIDEAYRNFTKPGWGRADVYGHAVSWEIVLKVPAVAAVRTISEAAASLRVKVIEIAADNTETDVPGHPVADLLKNEANDWASGREFIRFLMVDGPCS